MPEAAAPIAPVGTKSAPEELEVDAGPDSAVVAVKWWEERLNENEGEGGGGGRGGGTGEGERWMLGNDSFAGKRQALVEK